MAADEVGAIAAVNLDERLSAQIQSPLMEAIIMPILFWLALLLGYLTGVTAAVLLLPSRLIEPLYGPLALTTVVVITAFAVLLQVRRLRGRAASEPVAAPAPARAAVDPPAAPPALPDRPDEGVPGGGERWPLMVRLEPPGAIGPAELRQILYLERVDVRLRAVASLTEPAAILYHALPRLRSAGDEPLEPTAWRSTAIRAGLLGAIDRLLLLRCAAMLRTAGAEGRRSTVVCGIAASSLDDPGFMAELEEQLGAAPALADSLVLALDKVPGDRPSVMAASSLRRRGVRLCLRRLGPPPAAPAELRAGGFDFVLLDADRFALGPQNAAIDPALLELQARLGTGGPRLLLARAGAETVTISDRRFPAAQEHPLDLARPSAA